MKKLNILYVTSELSPYVTTGGLGDIAHSLPRALRELGHDVRLAMPCYSDLPVELRGEYQSMCVADLGSKTAWGGFRRSMVPGTDMPLYLVEHDGYFSRPYIYGDGSWEYNDNAERFCFFCLATLHGVGQSGWRPDIVHCHDWHTAAIPAYIKSKLLYTEAWRGMATLLTIHNLAHQGRYKAHLFNNTGFSWDLFTPQCLEYYGDMNLLKGGIAFASKLNTVSARYASEIQTPEYGEGLDGFLRTRTRSLHGILNGVDYTQWNPSVDPHIVAQYSAEDLTGKAACKTALQRELHLPARSVPLFGMVGRLYWQKGVDLIVDALDRMLEQDIQVAILGTGDRYYEYALANLAARHPDRLRVLFTFNIPLSHRVEAGSDFFLMPSHYEPCGLSQLYSLAYGTIPIVRETGGLADSVNHISPGNLAKDKATGVVFGPATADALLAAVRQAYDLYHTPKTLHAVRVAGMTQDFSWKRSSKAYVQLYKQAIAAP